MWLLISNENKSHKEVLAARRLRVQDPAWSGILILWTVSLGSLPCFLFLQFFFIFLYFLCCHLLWGRFHRERNPTLERSVSQYNNNLRIKLWISLKWHRKMWRHKSPRIRTAERFGAFVGRLPSNMFLVWGGSLETFGGIGPSGYTRRL